MGILFTVRKMAEKKRTIEEQIDLHPGAWERFERAAEVVGKSPTQHREGKVKDIGVSKSMPNKTKDLEKPGK
ncbi:hypothetical protein ABID58_001830 [Bradyrhizobium sp. S3.2.6]|uniref:hypothetical protein n=1 Tax=Bradyrhizobium sp. S3.2.6 TaxID=3156428 RepID=UPI0033920282